MSGSRLFRGISPGKFARGAAGIIGLAALWQAFALSGEFSPALAPTLGSIWSALVAMAEDGTLFMHTAYTLARVMAGIAVGCIIGLPIGIFIGRSRTMEKMFSPALSVLMPIPSLAWTPLLILWLGLGSVTTVAVVIYATTFPMIYSAWTGVRAVNPLWIKSADVIGASRGQMFWKVILPGAMPHIITGLRLAFGRGWIAVIGAELLAGTDWGLGRLIFEAKEWLTTDVVLAALLVIGVIGLIFEKLLFQILDARTVQKWGMATK